MSYDKYFLDSYHEYDNVEYASMKFLKEHFNLTTEQTKTIHKAQQVRRRPFHDNEMKAVTCYSVYDVKSLFQIK
ncbi:MAG TPA: hypothetical protein VF350_05120 [Candidatus Bathyarchaeia archaeon]